MNARPDPIVGVSPPKPKPAPLTLGQVIALLAIEGSDLSRAFAAELRRLGPKGCAPTAEDFCTLASRGLVCLAGREWRCTDRGTIAARSLGYSVKPRE